MPTQALPSVSVLIPTLNSGRTLTQCMTALREQNYPSELLEIIVADAGSRDDSVEIAQRFGAIVVPNPLTTGEAGKAAALRAATKDLVALIDSDNIVVGRDWLRRMVAPFSDPSVIGSEPMQFVAESSDTTIDRYCALFGVNDPLCLFIGNYDKYSTLSRRWTSYELRTEDAGDYVLIALDTQNLPTIGANGTMYRREIVTSFVTDYLMDIDIPVLIAGVQKNKRFAKVRVGIRHLFCSDVRGFIRKQRRRIRDFFSPKDRGHEERAYPWGSALTKGIARFVISCVVVIPLLYQSGLVYLRSRDVAAFFHPIACWITLGIYGSNFLFARGKTLNRSSWKQ